MCAKTTFETVTFLQKISWGQWHQLLPKVNSVDSSDVIE